MTDYQFDVERDLATARPGQRAAINTILERVRSGQRTTSIVLPTRYGKSDVMRLATAILHWTGDICGAIALEPNTLMRGQVCSYDEWNEMWVRHHLGLQPLRYREIDGIELDYMANGEVFVALNMQLFQRNIDLITPWVESRIRRSGHPLLLLVDETHFLAEASGSRQSNAWCDAVGQAMNVGAHVIELTATPYRGDNRVLPGFEVIEEGRKDVHFTRYRAHEDPDLVWRDSYIGETRRVRVRADHETTFGQAWNEVPSPLSKLSRWPFDVNLTEVQFGPEDEPPLAERHQLSELTIDEARKVLDSVVRDDRTIERGVEQALASLRHQRRRVGNNQPRMLIFVGNDSTADEDRQRDAHARRVEAVVQRVARAVGVAVRVEIATGNTADAASVIRRFADPEQPGDILILKQMAGLGLTARSVKTLLDLSTVRQPAACLQRWMRAATPFQDLPAVLVLPDDALSRKNFEDLVQGNGGATTVSNVEIDESVEMERREGPILREWLVDSTADASFDDSEGRVADAQEQPMVMSIYNAFPEILAVLTHAQSAERLRNAGIMVIPAMPETGPVDQGVEVDSRRQNILWLTKQLEKLIRTARREQYDPASYGQRMQRIWVRLYREAGVPGGAQLDKITDCDVLDRIIDAASNWREQLLGTRP